MEIQSENLQQLDKFPKAQLDSLLQKIYQLHSTKPYKNNQNSSGPKNDTGFSGDKVNQINTYFYSNKNN